jgi:hypothetical protein
MPRELSHVRCEAILPWEPPQELSFFLHSHTSRYKIPVVRQALGMVYDGSFSRTCLVTRVCVHFPYVLGPSPLCFARFGGTRRGQPAGQGAGGLAVPRRQVLRPTRPGQGGRGLAYGPGRGEASTDVWFRGVQASGRLLHATFRAPCHMGTGGRRRGAGNCQEGVGRCPPLIVVVMGGPLSLGGGGAEGCVGTVRRAWGWCPPWTVVVFGVSSLGDAMKLLPGLRPDASWGVKACVCMVCACERFGGMAQGLSLLVYSDDYGSTPPALFLTVVESDLSVARMVAVFDIRG